MGIFASQSGTDDLLDTWQTTEEFFVLVKGYAKKGRGMPIRAASTLLNEKKHLFSDSYGRGTRFAVVVAEVLQSMNTTKLNKTLKGVGLAFAVVFGLIAFAGVDANAQGNRNDRYPQDDRYYGNGQDDRYNGRDRNGNQSYRHAFKKGYNEGLKQGMRAARNRNRGNSRNNGGYYGNDQGYGNNGSILGQIFGQGNNRNSNNQAYQRGYQQGYREGLSRGRNNRRGNNNGRYNNGY